MGQRLSEPSDLPLIFGLSAVLVHKGTAVNSGHYVAHIKDEISGQWWEFDDEHVSELGRHPFGEGASCSVSKTDGGADANKSCSDIKNTISDENHANADQHQSSSVIGHVESYSSSDAYMLMYTLRHRKTDQNGGPMSNANHHQVAAVDSNSFLPSHLAEEINALNGSFIDACEKYKLRKETEMTTITERRQEVRSILSEAPVLSLEEPYFWLSIDWLRQWADNVTASPIDNTSIQCVHGKVPVSKLVSLKRLSAKAWTLLFSKYNGGPCLGKDDYCLDCLIDSARATVTADSYRDRRPLMKELAEAALAGKGLDGKRYLISKTWLQQWLRRKSSDFPCEADAGSTAAIRCPHGQLLPEQANGAKRVLIPENLWLFLREIANMVRPDDQLGSSPFPSDAETCTNCCMELSEVASLEDSLRAVKLKQRHNHEKLASGKNVSLSLNTKYYLLPSSWLSNWRSYINASGKTVSSIVEPDRLDGVINALICQKHSRLLERPLGLTYKCDVILQKTSTDGLRIISENDWKCFCEEWGGLQDTGILAEIKLRNAMEKNMVGLCEEMPITVDCMNDVVNIEVDAVDNEESKEPWIKTSPEMNFRKRRLKYNGLKKGFVGLC